jgi:hypothetical protein
VVVVAEPSLVILRRHVDQVPIPIQPSAYPIRQLPSLLETLLVRHHRNALLYCELAPLDKHAQLFTQQFRCSDSGSELTLLAGEFVIFDQHLYHVGAGDRRLVDRAFHGLFLNELLGCPDLSNPLINLSQASQPRRVGRMGPIPGSGVCTTERLTLSDTPRKSLVPLIV